MNVAKLLKQKKVNFFGGCLSAAAGEEFGCRAQDHEAGASDPAERTGAGSRFENNVRDVSSADKVISAIYTEESDNQARLNNASSLSDYRHDVLEATANLYLTRQVILEHA